MENKVFQRYIIFEDNHLLIVNKPNNILVQGDHTGDRTILDIGKSYLKEKYNKPGNVFLGLVHRLDRPVSGVLILARTSKALTRLNKQLKEKTFQKTYLAITQGKPEKKSGKIDSFLFKNTSKNVVSTSQKERTGSKSALTNYTYLKSHSNQHLIEVNPITGRSHQIRVHLSSIKCAIVGDLKYGAKYPLPDKSIALHCRQMVITHPVTKEQMSFVAPVPKSDIWKII